MTFADRLRTLKKNAEPHTASSSSNSAARRPMSSFRRPVGSENICGVFKDDGSFYLESDSGLLR
jgi:hypothetical protein